MDESTKRAIKKTILALRKLLEKADIPAVLKQYGIFPDERRIPVEKLALLDESGKKRRECLEAVIEREIHAVSGNQKAGVERYCREVAFTYLNRLIALRSMEVRGLIDECIKIRDEYAGRSLRHQRFLKENPGIQFDPEDIDSLKAFLRSVFRELQDDIKILFDPDDEYSIIMPSLEALRECIRALNEDISEDAFKEPELIGWVYQYFQTEEKDRVFEEVRTKKKKIEGDDIIPATSLYTEHYMVDYLVQNSLGAIWMEMHPDSKLFANWQYFVKEQALKPREPQPVKSLIFLDPACGSGHFHLVAFDLFVQMYEEEARLAFEGRVPKEWVVPKEKIAATILESNLHGIDIDLRSVQLTYLVLHLRMREHQKSVGAQKLLPRKVNLVAADASLLNTPEFLSWCEEKFKEEPYAFNIIKGIVGRLRNLSEIGSLARPEEDLKELIYKEKERLFSAWRNGKTPRQTFLFQEMLTPEQRELPFEKITDDQFWEGVLGRVTKALDEYYRDASERGDTRAQVLAHEASRGFKFLELCNKRYDVVATNPPYMGSGNMGKRLKDYVQKAYEKGKDDLYSAFILRCQKLTAQNGLTAMVTRNLWLFQKSQKNLREQILKDSEINLLADLGGNAFKGIGMDVAITIVLFTLRGITPSANHRLTAFRLDMARSPDEKDKLLRRITKDLRSQLISKPKQLDFLSIEDVPILYSLSDTILNLLKASMKIGDYFSVSRGVDTCDNKRFLRHYWEVSHSSGRYIKYLKAGGYAKWAGFDHWLLDWKDEGDRLKRHITSRYPYLKGNWEWLIKTETFFKRGWTYTFISSGCMGARELDGTFVCDSASPGIFSEKECFDVGAILNARLSTFLLRAMTSDIMFREGYVARIPYTNDLPAYIKRFVSSSVRLKKFIIHKDHTDRSFSKFHLLNFPVTKLLSGYAYVQSQIESACAFLHAQESIIEKEVLNNFGIGEKNCVFITEQTGTPAGWYSLIEGYNAIPEMGGEDAYSTIVIPKEVIEYLQKHERINLTGEELEKIKSRLRALYEAGPGAKAEDVVDKVENETKSDNKEEAELLIGKRIPIPAETFLEELSVKMEIHPISIYWLLKEMCENEGLVCWPECKRYVEDYITVMILRMLGFRWPKQVEANEPVPDWADKDGIIPITEHTEEKTLLERIRDRIGAEFGENKISDIESEFADILYNAASKEAEIRGKAPPKKKVTLAQWLEKEFFKRHTSQFKKRPIAWHLTSSNGTFQVLLFYHKISQDMLKNLKNRYLIKIQGYYGSLFERTRRGEIIPGGLTVGKLTDIEFELEEFSKKLDKIINMPYEPLIDDGVRVNIAPLQKVGLSESPVLADKDVDRAIADRNRWREDDKEQATEWRLS